MYAGSPAHLLPVPVLHDVHRMVLHQAALQRQRKVLAIRIIAGNPLLLPNQDRKQVRLRPRGYSRTRQTEGQVLPHQGITLPHIPGLQRLRNLNITDRQAGIQTARQPHREAQLHRAAIQADHPEKPDLLHLLPRADLQIIHVLPVQVQEVHHLIRGQAVRVQEVHQAIRHLAEVRAHHRAVIRHLAEVRAHHRAVIRHRVEVRAHHHGVIRHRAEAQAVHPEGHIAVGVRHVHLVQGRVQDQVLVQVPGQVAEGSPC